MDRRETSFCSNRSITDGVIILWFVPVDRLDDKICFCYSIYTSWAGRKARVHPAAGMFPAISCKRENDHEDTEHLCG